jgi:putative PIN family toxin of toxin-antitoxin system
VHPLRDRISDGRISIVTHDLAMAELRRVLSYRHFALAAPRQAAVLEQYLAQAARVPDDEHARVVHMDVPPGFPRCRDPDDNLFLALAYHAKAAALVSKDKRVLKCRRRARPFGFDILKVAQVIAAFE